MELKAPSRLEVLRALAAIADERVKLGESHIAKIDEYTVKWSPSKNMVTSNDPITDTGRPGYPAISMLMLQGILPYDAYLAHKLKGLNWDHEKEDEVVIHELLKNWVTSDKQKVTRFLKWITDMILDLDVSIYKETLADFV
ncbi:MAG: hypothetical protein GOU98_01775 [Candidatus Altiarchaeota archaeon]|nr:hypothetical protein [Candidatus Altiarchaeota archaeon]